MRHFVPLIGMRHLDPEARRHALEILRALVEALRRRHIDDVGHDVEEPKGVGFRLDLLPVGIDGVVDGLDQIGAGRAAYPGFEMM